MDGQATKIKDMDVLRAEMGRGLIRITSNVCPQLGNADSILQYHITAPPNEEALNELYESTKELGGRVLIAKKDFLYIGVEVPIGKGFLGLPWRKVRPTIHSTYFETESTRQIATICYQREFLPLPNNLPREYHPRPNRVSELDTPYIRALALLSATYGVSIDIIAEKLAEATALQIRLTQKGYRS